MSAFANTVEKLIIFTGCLVIYFCQKEIDVTVITVLLSIIFSGFLSYFDDDRKRTALTVGFAVLSFFKPILILFLPLIAYDMLFYKYQYVNLLCIIPLFNFFRFASLQTGSVVLVMLFFSIWIKYRFEAQNKLYVRYTELSDTTREMSLQVEKQNNDLIEKQYNELRLAALDERNRIAREIHDNVGHLLSSAILQSGALLTINQDGKTREHLKALNETLSQAMDNIRVSVHELYDESIDLHAQIADIVKKFTFCEISCDYQLNSNPEKKLKYAFISTVKEALSNIMKHSDATQASVILREHPALYQLIIRDNGTVKGYSMDAGLGLRNMMERVQSFRGNINILTENGFEIFISIPKEEYRS